jgi:cation-transporting ATPase E
MTKKFETNLRIVRSIAPAIVRNLFSFSYFVIIAVVILLFVFKDVQGGLFLGAAIFLAIVSGLVQDIRAHIALEKLQLLTTPRATRITKNDAEESVLIEEIQKGDKIKLKVGDQIPCDGILLSENGFEVNEALITGESDSFPKSEKDKILAGSIVTSGSGIMEVLTVFSESRISNMTKGIRKYSVNLSPIQAAVFMIVKYTGYITVALILFVVIRGIYEKQLVISIVKNIAALTSTIIPQGLIIATTLLFTYGAARLYKQSLLMREVNAIEKLGHIKNLCMDKTGTLTENKLVVEHILMPDSSLKNEAEGLVAAYAEGSGDKSQITQAIQKSLTAKNAGSVMDGIPFSPRLHFGGVHISDKGKDTIVLSGAPETFMPYLSDEKEREWLKDALEKYARQGKRLICVVKSDERSIPQDLTHSKLSVVAVFVIYNRLREGAAEMIQFFQDRGVRIRVITGDNMETAQAVSKFAKINNTEAAISGEEMAKWGEKDFDEKAPLYTIFARIEPEQKEKIIEALKKNGFTAMVGDGANDALAIKNADLGIAMFDGSQATRQLASIVLTDNSFAALPDGVRLADNIIDNIGITSSLFFNQVAISFFFFVIISFFGFTFPITPQNVTVINFFTIAILLGPIFFWSINLEKARHFHISKGFLRRILPFSVWSGLLQAIGVSIIFALSPDKTAASNTPVVLTFIGLGYIFFAFATRVYSGSIPAHKKTTILALCAVEIILLFLLFKIPYLMSFFNLTQPSIVMLEEILGIVLVFGFFQGLLARYFSRKQE